MNENEIKELQSILVEQGLLKENDIDGIMGPKTNSALKEYQKYRIQNDKGFINNTFPYGYSDDDEDTVLGVITKLGKAIFGKSNKREKLDEFVLLDLSTPEGIKRAKELRYIFNENFKDQNLPLSYLQNSARARYDLNALYQGKPQIFYTFMINPDYKSVSAGDSPTYIYRNPILRKQLQSEARSYGKKHGIGIHNVVGDPLTTFNNYTINTMHEDGSGRVIDIWDFSGDMFNPFKRKVVIGDTIPPTAPLKNNISIRKSKNQKSN